MDRLAQAVQDDMGIHTTIKQHHEEEATTEPEVKDVTMFRIGGLLDKQHIPVPNVRTIDPLTIQDVQNTSDMVILSRINYLNNINKFNNF